MYEGEFGAADGTRTRTISLSGDFKSPVSTDSTTATQRLYFSTGNIPRQDAHFWRKPNITTRKGEKTLWSVQWGNGILRHWQVLSDKKPPRSVF